MIENFKPSKRYPDRLAVQFRQLCAIARTVLLEDYRMVDGEWREAIKTRLAQLQFSEPSADMLSRAMSATEAAVRLTLGPRPTNDPAPEAKPPRVDRQVWLTLSDLAKVMRGRVEATEEANAAAPPPQQILEVEELALLNGFWIVAGTDHGNRLTILKQFSELAIVRSAEWDYDAVRKQATDHTLFADQCFACQDRSRRRLWHHIIQIQHGGSNTPRNRVCLCVACHADVHPWLPPETRSRHGFSSFKDWVRAGMPGSPV